MSGMKKRKPILRDGDAHNKQPNAVTSFAFVSPIPAVCGGPLGDSRLSALTSLASVPIETSLVQDLSGSLHGVFDHVCDTTLPIYFGPLLGRLYLEGL